MGVDGKTVDYLVVDTTAFIQNAPLQDVANKIITCQDVVDEILNKRQLKRLVVLPYDLEIKEVFSESIRAITEFAIKTGDYRSLSATDIKIMALTYQLEKEHVGVNHLRSEPLIQKIASAVTHQPFPGMQPDVTGFYNPSSNKSETKEVLEETELVENFQELECKEHTPANDQLSVDEDSESESDEDDDNNGWITPSNFKQAQNQVNSQLIEDKHMKVACMTTDFAMQNVLKQMNLNVASLDGRMIKQLRTFILRCYTCFKTTSVMTKEFCPKCGHNTLKKVAVSLDEQGKMQIHINSKRPLTARGKKFSLPKMKGGKHPNNPILVEDHPMPQNRASKLASMKVNALDDDYIAGYSPFAVRDVTSRSAQLGIKPWEVKHWMKKNPNEARRRRK